MSKKKYENLPEVLEKLRGTCSTLTASIKEFSQGTKASKEEIEKRPFLMRSFAQRDFESNTGMGFDEWVKFSERLLSRFDSISAAVRRLYVVKSDPNMIPPALRELRDWEVLVNPLQEPFRFQPEDELQQTLSPRREFIW